MEPVLSVPVPKTPRKTTTRTKIGQKSSGSQLCGVTKRGCNLGGIQRIGLHVRLDWKSYTTLIVLKDDIKERSGGCFGVRYQGNTVDRHKGVFWEKDWETRDLTRGLLYQ